MRFNGKESMRSFSTIFLGLLTFGLHGSATRGQTLTDLASFSGFTGDQTNTPLITDGQGNLYGTTYAAGQYGNGMIFKVNIAARSLSVLAPFNSTPPPTFNSGLIADGAGNFLGTTTLAARGKSQLSTGIRD
jgi:uncharacterized repeat protein (TIGR03803 family)